MLFQEEKNAGFTEEQLFSSFAYELDINSGEPKTLAFELVPPLFPFKNIHKQQDLFPFESILASTGKNKNGDVFLPAELFNARHSPIQKPINFNHVYNKIVGHMIGSVAIDRQGNIIEDENNIPEDFDIVVGNVLYKNWTEAEDIERMDQILADIEAKKLKASMECYFESFDYALYNSNGVQLIERTDKTSFLTKHLRWYGGTGQWDDYEIGRVLRKLYFSGKGLVYNQANERSIVLNTAAKYETDTEKEKSMAEENKNFEVAIAAIEKASQTTIDKLLAEAATKEKEYQKMVSELNNSVACHVSEAEKMKKEKDEMECEAAKKDEDYKSKMTAMGDEIKKTKSELESVKSELAKVNAEKTSANRLNKLTKAGFDEDKAVEFVQTWASVGEEQFDQMVSVFATKASAKEVDLDKAEAETKGKQGSGSDNAVASLAEELMKLAQESVQ